MVKKLFALASVTALTGLVSAVAASGCSSETVVEEPAGDSGTEGGKKTPGTDGGPGEEDTGTETGDCPNPEAVDHKSLPYKPPAIDKTACKEADLVELFKFIDANKSAKNEDVEAAMAKQNPKCAACVFADDGEKWSILVKQAQGAILNVGGCVEVVSGKEECGKAFQQFFTCPDVACAKCADQDSYDACSQDPGTAYDEACKGSIADLQGACGSGLKGYLDACNKGTISKYLIEPLIRAQCTAGGVSTDAGDGGK